MVKEFLKILRGKHNVSDDELVKSLPKGAELLQRIPQTNIPNSIAIVYTLPEPRRCTKISKPSTVSRPSAPKPKRGEVDLQ